MSSSLKPKKPFRAFLFLVFCAFCHTAFPQDVITKKNGKQIQARIIGIDTNRIAYRNYYNSEMPVHYIYLYKVKSVNYHDSLVTDFGVTTKPGFRPTTKYSKSNLLTLDAAGLAYSEIRISYERLFLKGLMGVRIPVNIGLDNSETNTGFLTGIDLNLHANLDGRIYFIIGNGFRIGDVFFRDDQQNTTGKRTVKTDYNVKGFVFNAALMAHVTPQFSLGITGTAGCLYAPGSHSFNPDFNPYGNSDLFNYSIWGITTSYRF